MGLFDHPGDAESTSPDRMVFLDALSEKDWKKLLGLVETRHFRAGDYLINAGEPDSSFYILSSGTVEVVLPSATGEAQVLTEIPEGSVFGEIAFFDSRPRSASIRAKTEGTAVRISKENLDYLAIWEPTIATTILYDLGRLLAERLRWTTALGS